MQTQGCSEHCRASIASLGTGRDWDVQRELFQEQGTCLNSPSWRGAEGDKLLKKGLEPHHRLLGASERERRFSFEAGAFGEELL